MSETTVTVWEVSSRDPDSDWMVHRISKQATEAIRRIHRNTRCPNVSMQQVELTKEDLESLYGAERADRIWTHWVTGDHSHKAGN